MIHSGLVSITFRQRAPAEVIKLVAQAGLEGIEWGGDIHVPHGDLAQARAVRQMTADAGLKVAAYGSYYRVGHREPLSFEAVLETAVELGAPSIRVWAGKQGSDTADDAYRRTVVEESRRIADLAQVAGLPVAYEFHKNTLTDSNAAARDLLEAVAHENIKSYWQPPRGSTVDYNLAGLDEVGPWLLNVHVFNWHISTGERLALAGGRNAWLRYLRKIASANHDPFAMIEFVVDDAPESFSQDAATLLEWLSLIQRER
jgi:3-dehydroshikimate dehydratase